MVTAGQITYDQIKKTNHSKFHDLEASMRLLYDHESEKGKSHGHYYDDDTEDLRFGNVLKKRGRGRGRKNKRGATRGR